VYTAADTSITTLVGLDILEAFDTIDSDVIASVCAASSWLWSYLCGRKQFVRLGGHSSPVTQCDCGIPQGSVLGLLLFTAYVSVVGELIESYSMSYHQFADDTQLLVNMDSTKRHTGYRQAYPYLSRSSRLVSAEWPAAQH